MSQTVATKKPMRDLMPEMASLVDAFRDAGATDNATISRGLKDGSCWFSEGGHFIGLDSAKEASDALSAAACKGDELHIITKADREQREAISRRKRGGGQ